MPLHTPAHLRTRRASALFALLAAASTLTGQTITTTTSSTLTVTVNSSLVRDHAARPMQLGFNVGSIGVQTDYPSLSNLWDSTTQTIRPALIGFLKTDYAGATYRFLNTTTDWWKVVGPLSARQTKTNGNNETYPYQFGLDEFLRFAEQVQGVPLVVMNTHWLNGIAITTDTQWQELKQHNLALLEYCNAPVGADWNADGVFQGQQRADNGHAAPYNVQLWELGNELDVDTGFTKELYAEQCADLAQAMRAIQPGLTILAHARTAPWGNTTWREWHNELLLGAGDFINGIAFHPYYYPNMVDYEGSYINRIGSDADIWAQAAQATAPAVCITEHAVWTNIGDGTTWPTTTSMPAAVAVVDMIISNEQRPFVSMAINHEMAARSPWAMFSELASNGYAWNTSFAPRPLAYASKLTQRTLATADILGTTIVTPKTGTNGYDVRATGYQYGTTGVQGAFMSNHGTGSYPTTLTLPAVAPGEAVIRSSSVGGPDGEAGITVRHLAVTAGTGGQMSLRIPACTVQNWMALGRNLALNGDFELGATGSTPTYWAQGYNTGVSGTTNLVDDAASSVNGGKVVRLQKTAGSSYLWIYQPGWGSNTAFGSSGEIVANPDSTIVVRANVRTAGVEANSVLLKMNCFSSAGFLSNSPASAMAPADTAGLWMPLQIEFSPGALLPQGATLSYVDLLFMSKSSTGYVDVDGITVMRRKNYARNGLLADADANGWADNWDKRIPAGSGGAIVYSGTTSPRYVTLSKTGGSAVQLVQTSYGNGDLAVGGTMDARRNEKWRLRARVRYQNLDASGVRLKVQYFDGTGAYVSSSPLGARLTGTNSAWTDVSLEFDPRDLIGAKTFGRAELLVQDDSDTGSVDVGPISLEIVD